jgi:MraZ protein
VSQSDFLWGLVGLFAFRGGPVLTLDAKGRLTVPARYRDVLMEAVQGQLVIGKNPARCLTLYPRPVWEAFEEYLRSRPEKDLPWKRLYIGSATEVEIDGASRVLVPPELREWAGLQRDVVFMGVGDRFELWDKATYHRAEESTLAQGLPEELQNLVPA